MDCIFCKIIAGEIPSVKLWEDDKFLAILDINPNTKGMTLVITKQHFESKIFNLDDENLSQLFLAGKKIAKMLERDLGVEQVGLAMDGTGVNHAHIKLFPFWGRVENIKEADERVYFEKFPGYLTTQLGPQADIEELKKLAEEIKNNSLEISN
jgi:diadenosine tetraphosphate (Ap4A) HIT family hydrolase